MSFTILLLSPDVDPSWPEKISRAVPGAVAKIYADPKDALVDIETADAAYGTVPRRRSGAGSVRRGRTGVPVVTHRPSSLCEPSRTSSKLVSSGLR